MKNLTTNWKTTLFGILAGVFGAIALYLPQFSTIASPLAIACTAAVGVVSKDGNVTGGTVAVTGEAQKRLDADAKSAPIPKGN